MEDSSRRKSSSTKRAQKLEDKYGYAPRDDRSIMDTVQAEEHDQKDEEKKTKKI